MLQQHAQFDSQTNDSFEWLSESYQRVTRIDRAPPARSDSYDSITITR